MPVSTTRACSAPRITTRDIVIGGFVRLWHVWLVAFHQSRLIDALFTFFVFFDNWTRPRTTLIDESFSCIIERKWFDGIFFGMCFPNDDNGLPTLPSSLADMKWASLIVYCIRPLIRRKVSAVSTGVNVGLSGRGPQRESRRGYRVFVWRWRNWRLFIRPRKFNPPFFWSATLPSILGSVSCLQTTDKDTIRGLSSYQQHLHCIVFHCISYFRHIYYSSFILFFLFFFYKCRL